MKKTEIYVPIANKKEAKQARIVLESLGEKIADCYMPDFNDQQSLVFDKKYNHWLVYLNYQDEKQITLKQLIELLVMQSLVSVGSDIKEAPKADKIAVRVDNEKEFNALMKYYDSLGWKDWDGDSPLSLKYPLYYNENIVSFENDFVFPSNGSCEAYFDNKNTKYDPHTYKIIPLSDFSDQNNIKLPLIKSEDGVWLYEGDEFYSVNTKTLKLENWGGGKEVFTVSIKTPKYDNEKYFKSRESALDWIEAQKPKVEDVANQILPFLTDIKEKNPIINWLTKWENENHCSITIHIKK